MLKTSSIKIFLPKGSKTFNTNKGIGPSILDVAKDISPSLAKETLGGLVNNEVKDLRHNLNKNDHLEIITFKHQKSLEIIRHSAAHVMAQAVQSLYDVQVTIGPVIDDGFYYDFYCNNFSFSENDFQKIETKMNEIIKSNLKIEKQVWTSKLAIKKFKQLDEQFKVEIIEDLNLENVSIYTQGDWIDLCSGPHVQSTGQIKQIALLKVAGSYWRGDETKSKLQRIYATAFNSKKDLKDYLTKLKEAKKRDHRILGKQLKLFYFNPHSAGSPFFTPDGTVLVNQLTSFMKSLYLKKGYQEVITPQIYDCEMYKTSGHYENFYKNMFFLKQDKEYALKPMNCPGHCLLYKMDQYSYKDLPLRIADFGKLHRFERSGVLHGLTRVRTMCQDDAHIFCTPEQLITEIKSFIEFLNEVYSTLGLKYLTVFVATRPHKKVGSDELWDHSEKVLMNSLEEMNIKFSVMKGEGAFYGPKMEFHITDAINRSWQLGTLQLDYSMPKNFELKYTDKSNKKQTPIMLHRAILGTLERFIGVYLEHCAGHLPSWLAPTQVIVMNVSENQKEPSKKIYNNLIQNGFRAKLDIRNETLSYKIRDAQSYKIPFFLIIGEKEILNKNVSVRTSLLNSTSKMNLDDFIKKLKQEINQKSYRRFLSSPEETI